MMALYKEDFPIGAQVRIIDSEQLRQFADTWKYHHPLQLEQLGFGGTVAVVEQVSFYHGGDVLYQLVGIKGIWHEQCLKCI